MQLWVVMGGAVLLVAMAAADGRHQLGEYSVSWSSAGRVLIGRGHRPPALESHKLLAASCGNWSAHETAGNFAISSRPGRLTDRMTVDPPGRISATPDRLVLQGGLSFDPPQPGCPPLRYRLSFQLAGSALQLLVTARAVGAGRPDRLVVDWLRQPGEEWYGLGTQYSTWELSGRKVPVWTQEQGVGRGVQPLTLVLNQFSGGAGGSWWSTYSAVPIVLSSRCRAILLENTEYAEFDLTGNQSGAVSVQSLDLRMRLVSADSPLQVIQSVTEFTGRMRPLPSWLSSGGAVLGYEGGTTGVLGVVDKLASARVPLAAVWLQDWSGVRRDGFGERVVWNWQTSYDRYPGWDQMLGQLRERGVRVLSYINPYLADFAGGRDLFDRAAALGYLVKNASGLPYIQNSGTEIFTFGTVDLTNPQARGWYSRVIQCNMLRVGEGCGPSNTTGRPDNSASVAGWMADFGEYIPMDAVLHQGRPESVHNQFPVLWAELNEAAVSQAGVDEQAVFFVRSSGARSPGAARLFWLGDQLVTFDAQDGLRSALLGMLSAGLAGQALTHSDIGGYTMIDGYWDAEKCVHAKYVRTRELLYRWTEMSALSDAIMRTHMGNLPNNSAQVYSDNSSLAHFGRMVRAHQALAPYRRELMLQAAASGAPLVRHPWLHYPSDARARSLTSQFMLGSELMAAPVLDANVSNVTVYLPDPTQIWVHWRRNERFKGGATYQVRCDIGELAVFARAEFVESSSWLDLQAVLQEGH